MKTYISHILIAVIAFLPLVANAQGKGKEAGTEDRQRWISEIKNYKHEFLTKELSLTDDEQDKFFAIYDEMDDELTRISTETRELEQKVISDENATETELNAATFALFQQKKREGEVELRYYEKLKDAIPAQKLIRLKNAERKFTQQLLRRHGRIKAGDKK